ncbi:MAG TPA: hypothetical protein VFW96_25875 [Thermomicrobiales bacterium]|nr:hypothetical protein [Thermomicrobiales bacterium]
MDSNGPARRGARPADGAAPWAPELSLAPPHPFQPGEALVVSTPGEVERLIEDTGARYVADLRVLTAELGRFYAAQLAVRDDQLAALTRRADDAEQARAALREELDDTRSARDHLAARLDESEREGARLAAQLADLRREYGQQFGALRHLSETLRNHVAEVAAAADSPPYGRP